MSPSRREFIKFVVAGSVEAGCPIDLASLSADAPPNPKVEGEANAICHQVRDGVRFNRPPASNRHEVVVVGGGVSGLTAAYLLRDHDILILEKEPHWGGNAFLEEYNGQAYATGSAFTEDHEQPAMDLAKELGLELLPISDADGSVIHGEFIPDTWSTGLDHLPYPAAIRESFKKFRRDVLAIPVKGRDNELDAQPFSKYLEGYAPEVKEWWDAFGPSNWGARTEETSAKVGIDTFQSLPGDNSPDVRKTLPGGLGVFTRRLAEILASGHRERMLAGATTIAVEQQKRAVHVTFFHRGKLKTVAAQAVIMATPKFITWRLVAGLPAVQKEAMQRIRYAPYPVVNLIFDKPVFTRGYDTWCPGNTFTDFVVADWTVRHQPSYRQKYNILTFYTPLVPRDRVRLLTEEGCRMIAGDVLHDFQKLFSGSNVDPVEIHLYRRGHPLYMSTPGNYTEVLPLTRHPMERIAFANTDSEGPVSTTSKGIVAAHRAVQEVEDMLAGKFARRAAALPERGTLASCD